MASISRELPPDFIDPQLRSYLERMFIDVNIALERNGEMPILTEVPAKPKIGKIYYFRNSTGAITAEGFWGYKSTGWVQLG